MDSEGWEELYLGRSKSRKTSVAAKLTTTSGNVYYGVNIESACHSLSNCAERVAISNAVCVEGPYVVIRSVEVVGSRLGHRIDIVPCGACRQLISEFADNDTIVAGKAIEYWLPNPYK